MVKRILTPITYVVAAVYLCADFVFAGIALPISKWLASRFGMQGLRDWIRSLPPYACLALLAVPIIVLEPVKFLAAYFAATGKWSIAVLAFCLGELLKLVLVERLFDLTRDKLMRIAAFAWIYNQYLGARVWVAGSEAWKSIRRVGESLLQHSKNWRHLAHRHVALSQNDR